MKTLNGTYRFKTIEQLLASGWRENDGHFYREREDNSVASHMIREFPGKLIRVVGGITIHHRRSWYITPPMVLMEAEEVEQILKRYEGV